MIIYVPLSLFYNGNYSGGGKMDRINVYIAGDSTASNYNDSRAPRAGWGQVIGRFMKPEVTVLNHASSGRSSKSFIEEGRLAVIKSQIDIGDFLLIQFGHNDSKADIERRTRPFSSYKEFLSLYIEAARENGAFPILITPVERRSFNEEGAFMETHSDYPSAMRELAVELEVPLIDLSKKSKILFEQLGKEKTKELFLWLDPGKHVNYAAGVQDDTHFSQYGAEKISQLILEEIKEQALPLANFI
jgi:lysophospholipase L1-like esterase